MTFKLNSLQTRKGNKRKICLDIKKMVEKIYKASVKLPFNTKQTIVNKDIIKSNIILNNTYCTKRAWL